MFSVYYLISLENEGLPPPFAGATAHTALRGCQAEGVVSAATLEKERLGPVEKRGQRKPAREDVLVHGKELSPERNEPWDVVNEMGSGLLQLPDPRWGTGSGQTAPGPAAFVGASQPEGSRVGA